MNSNNKLLITVSIIIILLGGITSGAKFLSEDCYNFSIAALPWVLIGVGLAVAMVALTKQH